MCKRIADEDDYNSTVLREKKGETFLEWEEGGNNAVGGINLTKLFKELNLSEGIAISPNLKRDK
jgi:hypothetical protein